MGTEYLRVWGRRVPGGPHSGPMVGRKVTRPLLFSWVVSLRLDEVEEYVLHLVAREGDK